MAPPFDLSTFLSTHYTPDLAAEIAESQRPVIEGMMDSGRVHRQALFMHFARARPDLDFPWLEEIYTTTFGQQPRDQWEYPYDDIASGKNRISGRTGELSRVIHVSQPQRLVDSDVEFWGNWVELPIIVACSGVKPWFDMAFSRSACGLIIASLEQILFDEYDGMTAEEAGLVTHGNTEVGVRLRERLILSEDDLPE